MENTNPMADYALELARKSTTQQPPQELTDKTIDIDKNNSYIKGNEQQSQDPDEKLFKETFNGDPKKLAEAYRNSQREFTKVQSSLREFEKYKNTVDQIEGVYSKDPLIKELLDAASKGQSAENYLKERLKSSDNLDKSSPSVNSKLGSGIASADENTLAKAGYLDLTTKGQYTAIEWQSELMKARLDYATTEVPRIAMEKTLAAVEHKQQELRDSQDRNTIVQTNNQRFESQFNEAVMAGYDFAGEHKDIYMQAVEEARYMLDRKNPKLIREDAFLVALDMIARKEGKTPQKQAQPLPKQQQQVNYNGKNIFSGGTPPQVKLSGLEAARAQIFENNQKQLNNRLPKR